MTNATADTTARKPVPARPMNLTETLAQIGTMNVLAVSGGRVGIAPAPADLCDCGSPECIAAVVLPVTNRVAVVVTLNAWDYYDVQRVRTRKTARGVEVLDCPVTYELTDVDCTELGDAVYRVSCYESYPDGI